MTYQPKEWSTPYDVTMPPCDEGPESTDSPCLGPNTEEPAPVTTDSLRVYIQVAHYFLPLCLALGLFGNIATIRIMLTKPFFRMPVSRLLIALAVSDTVVICLIPFNKVFVREFLGFDIRSVTEAGCRTFYWTFRVAKMTSSWIIVLISCERFVAVWLPTKAKQINSNTHSVIGIAGVFIFLGCFTAYWTSFADQLIGGNCIPNTRPPGKVMMARVFLVMGLSFYSFLPSAILVVLNSLTIYKLGRLQKQKGSLQGEAKKRQTATIKTTIMLMCVTIAFIILVNPVAMAHLVSFVRDENIFETTSPGMVVFREVTQAMEQLNNSINFILYVLCSQRFRGKMLAMFKKGSRTCFRPMRVIRVQPAQTPSVPFSTTLQLQGMSSDVYRRSTSLGESGLSSTQLVPVESVRRY